MLKPVETVKYIYDETENGIEYNYELINKEFKKMLTSCKAPKGLFMPNERPISKYYWSVFMSERSSSKTTQFLLYGMVQNGLYNSIICYVRKTKDQITTDFVNELFKVIRMPEYGYIEYLTNGRYNDIHVERTSKKAFYCKRDKNGLIEDISPEPFFIAFSVDQVERYYGFNCPTGDLIIFDEFSRGVYHNDEWVLFNNLLATLRRERLSVRLVLLSNTIDVRNMYLQELGISRSLMNMKKGNKCVVTAELGAKVYVEWLDVDMHKTVKFKRASLDYYGFANPKLKAIYGGDWEYKNYPRLNKDIDNEVIDRHIYIEVTGELLVVEVMTGDLPCLHIRPYTKRLTPKEDAIVYTDDEMRCNKPTVIKGNRTNLRWLLRALANGKVLYASNDCGVALESFVKNLQYI